jgi:hypothetical protein
LNYRQQLFGVFITLSGSFHDKPFFSRYRFADARSEPDFNAASAIAPKTQHRRPSHRKTTIPKCQFKRFADADNTDLPEHYITALLV